MYFGRVTASASFPLSYFLGLLWKEFLPEFDYTHFVEQNGHGSRFLRRLVGQKRLSRENLIMVSTSHSRQAVNDLTRLLLTKVNHTGSDVRGTTGQIMAPKAFRPVKVASPHWWELETYFSFQMADHKNTLIFLKCEQSCWLLGGEFCHLKEADVRFCHLTDSYVCMSVLSKGRSSSDMLMVVLRKVAAFCLCFGLLPILLHVESTENPTGRS